MINSDNSVKILGKVLNWRPPSQCPIGIWERPPNCRIRDPGRELGRLLSCNSPRSIDGCLSYWDRKSPRISGRFSVPLDRPPWSVISKCNAFSWLFIASLRRWRLFDYFAETKYLFVTNTMKYFHDNQQINDASSFAEIRWRHI